MFVFVCVCARVCVFCVCVNAVKHRQLPTSFTLERNVSQGTKAALDRKEVAKLFAAKEDINAPRLRDRQSHRVPAHSIGEGEGERVVRVMRR